MVKTHRYQLSSVLLEFPISVVEWAHLAGLEPTGDAVVVEGMVADTPGNGTLFIDSRSLVCLTLNAEIHDMVTADSAVVDDDVPRPQSDCVPLLHLKSLLAITFGP